MQRCAICLPGKVGLLALLFSDSKYNYRTTANSAATVITTNTVADNTAITTNLVTTTTTITTAATSTATSTATNTTAAATITGNTVICQSKFQPLRHLQCVSELL